MATISRRQFLNASVALGASAVWSSVFKLEAAKAATGARATPPGFPRSIELYRQAYQNWARAITVDGLWTCAPRTPEDVVAVANWAARNGWRLRPSGKMHNWSPLTVSADTSAGADKVILVDTTQHLTAMRVVPGTPATVAVETGATMEALLSFLERLGFGLTACPAPGDVTVGGVLAVGGHGNAVAAAGEKPLSGHTFGTVSNLVASLTAVVWDERRDEFVLRTFDRSQRDSAAFMVHLGRGLLTEVKFVTGANQNLRCVSSLDIPTSELYGPPGAGGRSMESLLDASGRVGTLWFAFTDKPWVKASYPAPSRPLTSRPVNAPYNYPFSDNIPDALEHQINQIVAGHTEVTPAFGQGEYDASVAGLAATAASDLWGPSKDLLLYVKPTTIRLSATSYAVVTRRDLVQQVVHDFAEYHRAHLAAYQAQGLYPINGPNEIRVTGIDDPADIGADIAPSLSAVAPAPSHPEWDTAVWIDTLTFADTPARDGANRFYAENEDWIYTHLGGENAVVRPEWSKGWAYTRQGAWTNQERIHHTIPDAFSAHNQTENWDWTVTTLDRYDPRRVFTNPLLDTLFASRAK